MKSIRTEVIVDAPPEQVWAVLTGFDRYGEWNPCILSIEGDVEPDQTLLITIRFAWLPPIRFKAQLDRFRQNEILGWHAVFLAGLFIGHHWFELHPLDSGSSTRFVHCETFEGLLSAPILLVLSGLFRQGYTAMNRALKTRVEQK